jgi:hypothetical protein
MEIEITVGSVQSMSIPSVLDPCQNSFEGMLHNSNWRDSKVVFVKVVAVGAFPYHFIWEEIKLRSLEPAGTAWLSYTCKMNAASTVPELMLHDGIFLGGGLRQRFPLSHVCYQRARKPGRVP